MLSEKQVSLLPERIAKRLNEVNSRFLETAGKRIKEIGELSPSDAQRFAQMVDFGADMDEISRKLAEISDKNISEIYEIFDIVAKDNDKFAEKCCAAQGIPFQGHQENATVKKWVQSLAAQTAKSYLNLTQNIAFMVVGKDGRKHLTPLAKAYRDLMDKAVLAVTTGVSDYQAEMRHALRQLADSGLRVKYTPLKGKAGKTVDYASGYSRRLDTAIRQNILWGVKECNLGMQERYGEEFGANGYEISYHSNPRPSHADMGGRQYVIGKGRRIKGKYYPSFSTVEGLLADYGCLHFKFSIICGVSEPTYDADELAALKEADKQIVTFEGKEYTRYEASQLQRKIETSVRHAKDRQIIAKAAGDDELRRQEQEKINLLTSKYAKLSKSAGLPTRKERMTVSGYRKVKETRELKSIANEATRLYNLGSEEKNIAAYLRDKPIRGFLESQAIEFHRYISEKEIVVNVPLPKITGATKHFQENLKNKDDRKNLTIEECKKIVDSAKITLYDKNRNNLKFIADNGYVILNLNGDIVTAVPQKWRKKYNKYLKG